MAPRRRRSPAEFTTPRQGTSVDSTTDKATVHVPGDVPRDVPSDMRRRREAALRLGPYGDGPVDPLDDLAGLPIGDRQPCRGEFGGGGRWRPCCGR
jgi:hypothetical protein